jgi:N-acetylglucosaminyldiphosphoundecaprenol N-acetyl-beta-D-mannosaminyltransferase
MPDIILLNTTHVHGMRIDRITMSDALVLAEQYIASKTPHHIVTADASMVVTAEADPEFCQIVENADLVTADGAGILWACKRLGTPIPDKVSGVDLSEKLIALSAEKKWRVFLFGAGPGVAEAAAEKMREKYPGANIVGARNGFFKPEDEGQIVEIIRAANPDILLVALGIPKQEKFITRHKAALGVPVMIGVGGTLDVFSGTVKRAPIWMQKASLEWFYRLTSDPKQFKKRLEKQRLLPKFVMMTLKSKAKQ